MNPASALTSETTFAVIGAGRLGTVLASALRAAGFDVRGPLGRDEALSDADIAILCVPDAAIPAAAASARPHVRVIGHVSGATALDAVDFSIHPLQTFTGSEAPDVFRGIGAAIDGRTDADRMLAEDLARTLGMTPFAVDDRATYHAAASLASNFVLALLDAAEELAVEAGVENPRDVLAPLVHRSIENWVERGAANALTGPISRGDMATVARQRTAVGEVAPHLGPLFDQLVIATRALASRSAGTSALAVGSLPSPESRGTATQEARA